MAAGIEKSALFEMPATAGQLKPQISSLTFQQQERLLLLQIEQERVDRIQEQK